jgi:hypothetical protein
MDQAGQGQVAPVAGQVLEAADGTGLIDLQSPLAHGRHLAEHSDEALLIHPLEQLQGLEAVAHRVLPQHLGLGRAQIAGGDAAPQILRLVRQLAVGLSFDQLQQQPIDLVAVLVWIELQQRLGQVESGDQIAGRHREGLAEPGHSGSEGPGDHQQAAQAAQGKAVLRLQLDRCLLRLAGFCFVAQPHRRQGQSHLGIRLGVGIAGVGHHRSAQQQPGLLWLAFFTGEHAMVVEGLGVLGLQLQQGLQQGPGLGEAALLQERADGGHGRASGTVGSQATSIRPAANTTNSCPPTSKQERWMFPLTGPLGGLGTKG